MLKIGRIPENVLKRSVIKQIKADRSEVLVGAKSGEECSVIAPNPDTTVVSSTEVIVYTDENSGYWGVNHVANSIASSLGKIIGISMSVLLPEGTEESELKQIIAGITGPCDELGIQLMNTVVEVSGVVSKPVITLTGIGSTHDNKYTSSSYANIGDDVVITKWIGIEGTSLIAKEKQEELKKRFSGLFVDTAKQFSKYASVIEDVEIACTSRVSAMHNVTGSGIYGALWEIADASGVGLEVDLLNIPIRQETVEICEEYGVNPYELASGGSIIIVAPNGYDIVRQLQSAGINAAVAGKITEGNDRVIINGDEKRFLVPPRTNEIAKII